MVSILPADYMRLQFACNNVDSLSFYSKELDQKLNTIFSRLDLIENKINRCVSKIDLIEEHVKTDDTKITLLEKDVLKLIDKDFEETTTEFTIKRLIQEQQKLKEQLKDQEDKINKLIIQSSLRRKKK